MQNHHAVDKYYCTRSSLCQKLVMNGYRCESVPNVYDPTKKAWSFDLTPQMAREIYDYFMHLGRSSPRVIIDYLAEHPDDDNQQGA